MKDAISELRSAICRLEPHLLVCYFHSKLLASQQQLNLNVNNVSGSSTSTVPSPILQLQTEAAVELVGAISTFVTQLDSLWSSSARTNDGNYESTPYNVVHHGRIEEKRLKSVFTRSHTQTTNNTGYYPYQEPFFEWNETSKALIRKGYGLIKTASSPSTFREEDTLHNVDSVQLLHQEDLKTMVRNSILHLLPILNTSSCRHFVLEFLPYFLPWSMLDSGGGSMSDREQYWLPPSWLQTDYCVEPESHFEKNKDFIFQSQDVTFVNNAMNKLLETFKLLMQNDPSVLAPFLATLSFSFDYLRYNKADAQDSNMQYTSEKIECKSDKADIYMNHAFTITEVLNNARKECFHICLDSLPSISEYDLPSIIHSIFSLVLEEEEGKAAIEAIRREWISICDTQHTEDLALFIGNVIIECYFSDQTKGSKYLVIGFLDVITESLRPYASSCKQKETEGDVETWQEEDAKSNPLTILDVIIMTGIYSNRQYQPSIEAIIDILIKCRSFSALNLILQLIRLWKDDKEMMMNTGTNNDNADRLLYEHLVSPLISLLIYILIASSSPVRNGGYTDFGLVGGVMQFCCEMSVREKSNRKHLMLSFLCCRMISNLYTISDSSKRDQIFASLISMLTISYVQNSPHTTKLLPRSKVLHDDSCRHTHVLVASAYSACRTLLLIVVSQAPDLSHQRGVLLDRLLLLASFTPSTSLFRDHMCSEGNVAYALFEMNCALLIAIEHGNGDDNIMHHSFSSDLLILCQKLLFSTNVSSNTLDTTHNHQRRLICGMILASRLLRCTKISRSERKNVWNWVMTILSPTLMSAIPVQNFDPEIGCWGLRFMRFASANMHSLNYDKVTEIVPGGMHMSFPEVNCFVETNPVCGEGDMFNQVNKMLATTGVIQMETSLKIPSHSTTSNSLAFLAFNEVPAHYVIARPSHKKVTTPSFVVCAPYFLSGMIDQSKVSIRVLSEKSNHVLTPVNTAADYVYELVDSYLQLGKNNEQGWNPRGWLLSKIQLPCCLPNTILQLLEIEHHKLELQVCINDKCLLFDSSPKSSNSQERWKLLLDNIMNDKKSRSTLVLNLIQFMSSIGISISVSCAVLKHANEHLLNWCRPMLSIETHEISKSHSNPDKELAGNVQIEQKKKKKQLDALRKLLQFQLEKIHVMQAICKDVFLSLKGMYTIIYRNFHDLPPLLKFPRKMMQSSMSLQKDKNRDIKYKLFQSTELTPQCRRISLFEMKFSLESMDSFLKSSVNTVDRSTLWNCLLDDVDDSTLRETFRARGSIEDMTDRSSAFSNLGVHLIIFHRKNVLEKLQQFFVPRDDSMNTCHLDGLSLLGMSRVFNMVLHFFTWINGIDEVDRGKKRKRSKDNLHFEKTIILNYVSYHCKLLITAFLFHTKTLMVRSSILDDISVSYRRRKSTSIQHDINDSGLAYFIRKCACSITRNGDIATSSMSASVGLLQDLLLKHFEQSKDCAISCYIIDLLSMLLMHIQSSANTLVDVTWKALHSIYTPRDAEVNLPYLFSKMNQIVLCGLENKSTNERLLVVSESFTLFFRTATVLISTKDSYTATVVHHLLSHWSALILEGSSQCDYLLDICEALSLALPTIHGKSQGADCRNKVKHQFLPALNEKTFTSVFELSFQMLATSISLSKPHHRSNIRSESKPKIDQGPYGDLMELLAIFSKSISFFLKNQTFFPKRIFFCVLKTALLVIKLCGFQLYQCIEWRIKQPLLFENPHEKDYAKTNFLEALIDSIAQKCIGSITLLCNNCHQPIATYIPNIPMSGTSDKHCKGIIRLFRRCDEMKEMIRNICQTQNLETPVNLLKTPAKSMKPLSESLKHSMSALVTSSKRRNYYKWQSSKQRRHDSEFHNLKYSSDSSSSKEESNEIWLKNSRSSFKCSSDSSVSGSENDDSFGAIGDWGILND